MRGAGGKAYTRDLQAWRHGGQAWDPVTELEGKKTVPGTTGCERSFFLFRCPLLYTWQQHGAMTAQRFVRRDGSGDGAA